MCIRQTGGPPRDNVAEQIPAAKKQFETTTTSDTETGWCEENNNGHEFMMFFMGFESTKEFEDAWKRLDILERWKDLSIRPSVSDCHPDDRFLLPPNYHHKDDKDDDDEEDVVDDLQALTRQSDIVRTMMNDILANLRIETTEWDSSLVADKSQISCAGLGLFYRPCHDSVDNNSSTNNSVIPKDSVICYYTGHIHSFSSSRRLVDDKSYLLSVRGDLLVDPRLCTHVKARYINDPLHDEHVNCVYKDIDCRNQKLRRLSSSSSSSSLELDQSHMKHPPPRLAVVTLRAIQPNEELFVSYGEAYWNQHQHGPGRQYSSKAKDTSSI